MATEKMATAEVMSPNMKPFESLADREGVTLTLKPTFPKLLRKMEQTMERGGTNEKTAEIRERLFILLESLTQAERLTAFSSANREEQPRVFLSPLEEDLLPLGSITSTGFVTSIFLRRASRSGGFNFLTGLSPSDLKLQTQGIMEVCHCYGVSLSSVSSLYNGRSELPDPSDLGAFLRLCQERGAKISSITGMFAGRGLPKLGGLGTFLDFPEGRAEGLGLRTREEKGALLASITSMQNGRGLPELGELGTFLNFVETRVEALELTTPDQKLAFLSSITSMQHGKGLPKPEALGAFLDFIEGRAEKLGLRTPDEKLAFLSSITGMEMGKGLPNLVQLAELLDIVEREERSLTSITVQQLGVRASLERLRAGRI